MAAKEMRLALALAPDDVQLQIATAAAELQAGWLDDALTHVRAGAKTAVGQALLGDVQEKGGDYVEAVKAYQQAVALEPDREQYRVALALELVQHYSFEPAIAVLQQAAPMFPKSARIRTLLGIAQYGAGHYEEAEMALTEALQIDTDLEPVYGYLAQVALESPSAPIDPALQAICTRDAITCAALKSRAVRSSGDTALEERVIAELKRAPKDNAVARCELGRAYQAQHRWTEAQAELEACVQLDGSPQNHYRLGVVYSRLGLSDKAQKEMAMRSAAEEQKSEDVARRQRAITTFQYVIR